MDFVVDIIRIFVHVETIGNDHRSEVRSVSAILVLSDSNVLAVEHMRMSLVRGLHSFIYIRAIAMSTLQNGVI